MNNIFKIDKIIFLTGTCFGLTSVILGAFGAHGLEKLISQESLQTFETGVRYQMYHALLLLFLGATSALSTKAKQLIFYLVLIGVFFFSGSIYGLATNQLTAFNFKNIALITPVGGLFLITAWILLLRGFLKIKSK